MPERLRHDPAMRWNCRLGSFAQDDTLQPRREVRGLADDGALLRLARSDKIRGSAITSDAGQVTVMFSDLVGSTALSARMDPEDLREVISTYQSKTTCPWPLLGQCWLCKLIADLAVTWSSHYPHLNDNVSGSAVRDRKPRRCSPSWLDKDPSPRNIA
jgi:hypothetical protein